MKQLWLPLLVIIAFILIVFAMTQTTPTPPQTPTPTTGTTTNQGIEIIPVQHASTILRWNDTLIAVDPSEGSYENQPAPQLVLITDIHRDHLNTDVLTSYAAKAAVFVAPAAVAEQLPEEFKKRTVVLNNGETTEQLGFRIEAVPMYNLPERDDAYHTKGRGNGYVVEQDGTRVYFSGDTADIPEMRALQDIDIAFVCMNLPYTMTVEAAADAVLAFAPKRVYPYHYRGTEGLSDVAKFKQIVNEGNGDIEVVQLDWYPDT